MRDTHEAELSGLLVPKTERAQGAEGPRGWVEGIRAEGLRVQRAERLRGHGADGALGSGIRAEGLRGLRVQGSPTKALDPSGVRISKKLPRLA
mmetsp:Transcript_25171/g.39516  ORF Transcript_25171/g.39516 Transcript_25171/m.39516 type:complete len:93 (+) Transcript_25171:524-802(+)